MTPEDVLEQLAEECHVDHVGLWEIVHAVRLDLGSTTPEQTRALSLRLVDRLLNERGMLVGHPAPDGRHFIPWGVSPDQALSRIDREWSALGHEPNIGEVAWFTSPEPPPNTSMSLSNCRVVLVRTKVAANIGAAARALRNMGLSDFVLVAPEADPTDPRAEWLATPHALDLLRSARVVPTFEEAVADCLLVAATSANVGGLFRRQSVGTPEDVAARLLRVLPSGPAALVFGPEPSGLSNEEVARCHYLIHVPTDPAYPALNLAQAVVVCTYALRIAFLRQTGAIETPEASAPYADQERMFRHLRAALTDLHFLYGDKADSLMHAELRHLIARAGPTTMEVKLLHGLARQIEWQVRQGERCGPAAPLMDDPGPG